MRRPIVLAALMVTWLPGCCATAAPKKPRSPRPAPPARTHQITAEDYFSIAHVTAARPSPDGKAVVYGELRWDPTRAKRNVDLWLAQTNSGATRRLTFHTAADHHPRWSRDGRWLYFLSARADPRRPPKAGAKAKPKQQVWRIRPDGSGLMAVTRKPKGVKSFDLGRAGVLYFTVGKEHFDQDPWRPLRKKYKKLGYGHGVRKPTELWRLDLRSWRERRLLEGKRVIRSFAVAPDESQIALLTAPDRHLVTNEGWSRLDLYRVKSGKLTSPPDAQWRARAPSPYGWLHNLSWSHDSRQLAFAVSFDGYPGEIFVLGVEQDRGVVDSTATKLTRQDEATLGGQLRWRPRSNDLCYRAIRDARDRIYCTTVRSGKQGQSRLVTAGPQNVEHFAFTAAGDRIVAVMSGLDHPPDVFILSPRANRRRYRRLTRVNPQVDTWKLPQIKAVRWQSRDGSEVEGILELPPGHDGKKRLPLLVELHGGPTSATRLRMRFWIYGRTLYAARGWAMLSPNYRGSTGYGDRFLTDLIGHKNDRDVADIESGVDAMIARGIADPKRMALMGWSNGGYLTNCLITRTSRYKAASSGAGIFDTAMQWMIEDTPGHVVNFNRGLPWARSEAMKASSPLFAAHKIKTPTLIHVGAKDARVPPQHSRALYRALRRYLKVPTELVVYPGEPHSLTQREHREAKMRWDIKWLDHWVLGKKQAAPRQAKD